MSPASVNQSSTNKPKQLESQLVLFQTEGEKKDAKRDGP